MKDKRGQGSVLLFYIMVISLFLFGTFLGNQTVATVSEMIPIERLHRVVIDAGHGGEDGGAVSCSGRNESNYNLQIALRVNDLLHLLGYDTVMIHRYICIYSRRNDFSEKGIRFKAAGQNRKQDK